MENERPWAVVVHNDNANTFVGVAYVMGRVFGLPVDRGFEFADDVHESGEATVTWCSTQEAAEQLAARLQVHGLRATIRSRS
ncbi:ATP-dependent Clp protease adaptor ClpS [Amycolatopsis dongchuanensis]|uniref:Adaptor protein ClpS core domain-containing protein n=1 Tax=Amycolatopsis dongchuanensis TaxID=1070866 RepID=A0ABP9PZA6_9PSEU